MCVSVIGTLPIFSSPICFSGLLLLLLLLFETGIFYVALAVLDLILQTRLASNLEICLPCPCSCLLNAGD